MLTLWGSFLDQSDFFLNCVINLDFLGKDLLLSLCVSQFTCTYHNSLRKEGVEGSTNDIYSMHSLPTSLAHAYHGILIVIIHIQHNSLCGNEIKFRGALYTVIAIVA